MPDILGRDQLVTRENESFSRSEMEFALGGMNACVAMLTVGGTTLNRVPSSIMQYGWTEMAQSHSRSRDADETFLPGLKTG